MSNVGEGGTDHELVSVVLRAESCLSEIEEMPSGSNSSELGQLAGNVPSAPKCCELAARKSWSRLSVGRGVIRRI